MRRAAAPVLLTVLTLAAAGCGEDLEDSGIPDGSQSATAAAAAPAETSAATGASGAQATDAAKTYAGSVVEPIGNAQDLSKKPKIPKPSGTAPSKLTVKDLKVGTGAAAKPGDNITMRYVGVSYSTGKQFDASWDNPGNAFPFQLGAGSVIQGWDEGIVGMKVGGRRELVIPAAQGYGDQGSPPTIKGGETLVFVVDLTKIG